MKNAKKQLFKLLDTDSAEHIVGENNYINAENIRFSPSLKGGFGYFESVPGNEALANQVEKPCVGIGRKFYLNLMWLQKVSCDFDLSMCGTNIVLVLLGSINS